MRIIRTSGTVQLPSGMRAPARRRRQHTAPTLRLMSGENLGQTGEGLLIAAAPLTHDDALGLLDDRPVLPWLRIGSARRAVWVNRPALLIATGGVTQRSPSVAGHRRRHSTGTRSSSVGETLARGCGTPPSPHPRATRQSGPRRSSNRPSTPAALVFAELPAPSTYVPQIDCRSTHCLQSARAIDCPV